MSMVLIRSYRALDLPGVDEEPLLADDCPERAGLGLVVVEHPDVPLAPVTG